MSRRLLLGGVVGPVGFVTAWAVGAAVTSVDYSSIDDAISRLAAVGADTRPLMTTGFVVFGVGLVLFALGIRRFGGAAWIAAATTGVATLAVAAAPLDRSATVDGLHGLFAGIGYVSLVATPLCAVGFLRRRHDRALVVGAFVAAVVAATALALTPVVDANGLFQRIGLTAGDVWIVAAAIRLGREAPRSDADAD